MKKIIILISVLLYSCSQGSIPNENYYESTNLTNYHNVINKLLKEKFKDIEIVVMETKVVHRGDTLDGSPKIGYAYLNYYADNKKINTEDVEYIYNQIDSTSTIMLDSTKIETKMMDKNELHRLFKKNRLNDLKKEGDIKSIATFSTPLFSKDKSKIIFWVDIWHGPLNACGYVFIVSQEKGEWKIVEQTCTYIS